jgi:hypothetical protein
MSVSPNSVKAIAGFLVLILGVMSLSAQKQNDEDLLRAREAVWRAWFAGDMKTLEELVPPETIVMSGGEEKWKNQADVLRTSKEFHARGGKASSAGISTDGSPALWRGRYRVEQLRAGVGSRRQTHDRLEPSDGNFRSAERAVDQSWLAYGRRKMTYTRQRYVDERKSFTSARGNVVLQHAGEDL